MAQELKSGLMAQNTKGLGNTIRQTAKANFGMRTGMFTKDSGKMTKPMDMVSTSTSTALNMKVSGKMICRTAKV